VSDKTIAAPRSSSRIERGPEWSKKDLMFVSEFNMA
jgi:hypothetical protein